MSSITINKRSKIVLFTAGLGCDGDFFNPTITKLLGNSAKVKKYNTIIDMKDFDVQLNYFKGINSTGYYGRSDALFSIFNEHITNINTLATENKGYAILVRLSLQFYPYYSMGTVEHKKYDSIENQAKKVCFIIDKIKEMNNNVDIVLVGHSQGGLVNLEAAILRNTLINKVISIATPYKPVLAADLMVIPIIMSKIVNLITGYSPLTALDNFVDMGLDDENCQDRILTLSSSSYYNSLKNRWNSLQNRPSLTVITGTSGHLVTIDAGVIRMKQSFDGLVRTSEQKEISHANIINLGSINAPCFIQKTLFNDTCFDIITSPCYFNCNLDNFSLNGILFRSILTCLYKKLTIPGYSVYSYLNNQTDIEVLRAIDAGLERNNDFNLLYSNYYNIYASDYSHMFIAQCDETIGRLLLEFDLN